MIFSRFKLNAKTILQLSGPEVAYVQYRKHRINLLTGFPEDISVEQFQRDLAKIKLNQKFSNPTVYHFNYEYALYEQGASIDLEVPLVLVIEYQKSKKVTPKAGSLKEVALKTLERPTWSEYKNAFLRIQRELLDGNCYQVNLTYPFDFYTEEQLDPRDLADYFFSRKGLGAFAHATYFGDGMFLSNSPECLFQYEKGRIFTMPIKGTKKCEKSEIKLKWKEFLGDKKEEGELLMITDLLKNDLNLLSNHKAQVKKLRAPLVVPGLLHQYSLIAAKLPESTTISETMHALFPGGSITGAPKKRVMEIISEVERFQRGIYCGSTLLCYGHRKVASINIRTAAINPEERTWRYGAGGGVTLLSNAVGEYKEMELKVDSFLKLLGARGA